MLFYISSATSQGQVGNFPGYKTTCTRYEKVKGHGQDALDVKANKILHKGQILVSFFMEQSDSISVIMNDSIVAKKNIAIIKDKTGDLPDYTVRVTTRKGANIISVLFEREKKYFSFKIDKRYRIYQVHFWKDCFSIIKKKYFRYP